MCFNWASTASFITFNKRGVKNLFQQHYWQYKIDTASVYKVLFSSFFRISHSGEKIKVVSIGHLKQKLSLDNN